MSTAPFPGLYPAPAPNSTSLPHSGPMGPRLISSDPKPDDLNLVCTESTGFGVRRRASLQQGRGLEIVGHAVEYLIDSRMFMIDRPSSPADAEAVQILMRLSREVFAECTQVAPPVRKLRLWINAQLSVPGNC